MAWGWCALCRRWCGPPMATGSARAPRPRRPRAWLRVAAREWPSPVLSNPRRLRPPLASANQERDGAQGGSPHPAVPMHGAHRPNRTRAACACVGSPSASCQKELCSGGSQDLRRPQGGKLELGGGELSATVTATATATFGRAAREARCATPGTAPSTFVPLALLLPAALFSRGQGAIV